ncbi:MAG: GNAT family N-acetyltransferase [Anaerolineae bacterium]
MNITLQPITKDNWKQATKLKLEEHQTHFVAPNWYSILQTLYQDFESWAYGIYDGEGMVGFAMIGYDAEHAEHWIVRLMVDKDHQKKGYGRAAMHALIEMFRSKPDCNAIFISFEPDNIVAQKLYASLGFEDINRIDEGELVYRLTLT